MLRFLIPACLLLTLTLIGCGPKVEPKTADPVEIEKIRQQAIQNSQREIQSGQQKPAIPAN